MPRPTRVSFDPADFRRLGATAEFDPRLIDHPTGLVRVVKVTRTRVVVETLAGERIRCSHLDLIPTAQTYPGA